MPNQANKSKDQSNIVKPKRHAEKASVPNTNQEQSGNKQNDSSKSNNGSSGNASKEGRDSAEDSNPND
jgi:hypothetical protein